VKQYHFVRMRVGSYKACRTVNAGKDYIVDARDDGGAISEDGCANAISRQSSQINPKPVVVGVIVKPVSCQESAWCGWKKFNRRQRDEN
jgi:hypothetical protein